MSEVNKVQLVDPSKLNEILQLIKADHENNKLLHGIKNKDEFSLIESKDKMEREKKNNNQIEENIVSYLKKKEKIKRKGENLIEEDDNGEQPGSSSKKKTPSNLSELQIIDFLKKKNIKRSDSKMTLNNYEVNYEDVLYDLTHNVSKTQNFNLTYKQQNKVLKEF